ncbi:MAG TPA: SdrD B-like domain-containing protein, partial [Thermoflexales bacterium]|nr:SdrD B-like domain-containing protein [Thermoflexales bacterium]
AEYSGTINYYYTRTVQGEDVFTLTLYQNERARDFTFVERVGGLSGYVYLDANNNGLRETNEAAAASAVPGAQLQISGTGILSYTSANAQGFYIFTPLPAGIYTITETYTPSINIPYFDYPFCSSTCYQNLLDGKDQIGSLGGITLADESIGGILFDPVTRGVGYNFGELKPGRIQGYVYRDDDGDLQVDAGEELIGVTVTLSGTDDTGASVLVSETTQSIYGYYGGYFRFKDLRPGNYVLMEDQPANVLDGVDYVDNGAPGVAGNDIITGIILGVNADFDSAYFFSELPAGLGGKVFADRDGDGLEGYSDTLMQGIQVVLSGTMTGGGAIYSSTSTNAQGAFLFSNVPNGVYALIETQVSVYLSKAVFDGPESAGANGGITSTDDIISGIPYTLGTTAIGYNFAEYFGASLAGSVYFDIDENGGFNTGQGDVPIPNATLNLNGVDYRGAPRAYTATTNAGGNYAFSGAAPGLYTLTEQQPAGWSDGAERRGQIFGPVSYCYEPCGFIAANDTITGLLLGSDSAGTSYLFAEKQAGIGGFVFRDSDNDGVKDPGEPGIGVGSIQLSGFTALGAPVTLVSPVDAGSGAYRFTGIATGTYTLTQLTQP